MVGKYSKGYSRSGTGWGGIRLNLSAQDKDTWWWALVNAVMFHIRALGNIYTYIYIYIYIYIYKPMNAH